MRRLFRLLFQLAALAIVIFLLTAAWIVFDGLNDLGEKADVALVTGQAESSQAESEARLDRVVQLYNQGEFPAIIVAGSSRGDASDEPRAMTQYLERHGISSSAIIEGRGTGHTLDAARAVAGIMKSHQFESVMLVTDYYHMTRTKVELNHEGIAQIQKAHVGKLQPNDAVPIGREVVALYAFLGETYLLPAAEKVKEEAQVGADKAKADAEKAKQKVDKSLDSLPKG
jgi:vancomycin permeability regulator SanA